jgi:Fanconi anemia group D2 protein
MLSSKTVSKEWYHAVELLKRADDHKPLDLILLFLLHELPNRKRYVESLFRSKIRAGFITKDLVRKTLKHHSDALRKNFDDILTIAELIGQSRGEPSLHEFALVLYQEAFLHFDTFCKQNLVADLVTKACGGADGPVGMDTSIRTLSRLALQYPAEAAKFSLMFVSILDHVGVLDLAQVRSVYDLLAFLAYYSNDPECSGLKDNLHIVVRKQIVANHPVMRRMGALGAVMAVKNMNASIDSESRDDGSASYEENSSVTLDAARKMLERVWDKTRCASAEVGPGIFMDELSAVVRNKTVNNRKLVGWIEREIASGFQEEFLVELGETSRGGDTSDKFLPMDLQYSLVDDSGDSMASSDNGGVAMNLCPLVVHAIASQNCPPALKIRASRLLPHFRLLSACSSAMNQGDLDAISGLLSCPVWMPQNDVLLKFDSFSKREKNVTCATLFYCANWFRELLNAFAPSADGDERRRNVLNRLKDLITVQKDIKSCLATHTSFVPQSVLHLVDTSSWQPPAAAASGSRKGKGDGGRGKKRKADEESLLQSQTQQAKPTEAKTVVSLEHYAPFFRELDFGTFSILSYNTVTIESEPDTQEERKEPKLRPVELSFLLGDLLVKLDHSLISAKTKKAGNANLGKNNSLKSAVFTNLDQLHSAQDVASQAVELIDYLLGNLDVIAGYFKNLVALNDGSQTDCAALFSASTPAILDCYEIIFNVLNVIFGWNGFAGKDQHKLLSKALHLVGRRNNSRLKKSCSVEDLADAAIKHLTSFSDSVMVVGCGEAQIRVAVTLSQFSQRSASALSRLAATYLKRTWQDASGANEKGARFNASVETLLKLHLSGSSAAAEEDDSEERFKALGDYVSTEMGVVLEGKGNKAVSEVYPTFNKSTFALHYKLFLEFLSFEVRSLTFTKTSSAPAHFSFWHAATQILHELVAVVRREVLRPSQLGHLLKHSRFYFDAFLKNGMLVLDRLFCARSQDCLDLLKVLQVCTRQLQHVCSHSKLSKDVAISMHVPMLKKNLETFLYRVKAMLALNDAADTFWMGTLKNRKLDGEVIRDDDEEDEVTTTTGNDAASERSSVSGGGGQEEEDEVEQSDSDVEINEDDDDENARPDKSMSF